MKGKNSASAGERTIIIFAHILYYSDDFSRALHQMSHTTRACAGEENGS